MYSYTVCCLFYKRGFSFNRKRPEQIAAFFILSWRAQLNLITIDTNNHLSNMRVLNSKRNYKYC